MMIRVQYFSTLRDLEGPTTLELPENAVVGDAVEELKRILPRLANWEDKILIAVGVEFAPAEQVLQPDDLLSLMPPVQGG